MVILLIVTCRLTGKGCNNFKCMENRPEKIVEEFIYRLRLLSFWLSGARMRTVFQPYISSVGPNCISFFSNISAKTRARLAKLSSLIDLGTPYRTTSLVTWYFLQFGESASPKIFRFSRLSRKRGHVLYWVVPHFEGYATPYEMPWQTGD